MTERLTLEEAKRLGILDGPTALRTSTADSPELKLARAELRRNQAFIRLLRGLLDAGLVVRLEFRFHPERKWRFDLALLDCRIALEIDGGAWIQGRHHRPAGRDADNEKSREAQRLGWMIARVGWDHVTSGEALVLLLQYAEERRTR
jgi:very-short-patch-repair endonuclease